MTKTQAEQQIRAMNPAKQTVQEFLSNKLTVILATPMNESMIHKNLFSIGMDSYGFMELITEVESEYGIQFDEQDLVSTELQTLSGIQQIIEKKKLS